MLHDTRVAFDMRARQGAEPVPHRYQPALSLHNSDLVAIRARHHRDRLVAAPTWPDTVAIWLNPTARALAHPDFPRELGTQLRAVGVAPARISLELPEAAAMAIPPHGLLTLSALRDIGVGLILTEFGGAIASLSALKRLPLTAMTLSPALVHSLPTDREDAGLVRAAISAADTLGLAVIADGVATPAQRNWLADQGCLAGLGPFFAAPMSAQGLATWLAGTCQPDRVAAIQHCD